MSVSEAQKFKKSQFLFFGTYATVFWLVFSGFILWAWYQSNGEVSIWPGVASFVIFFISCYGYGTQQYYFILTEKELVVKNHWFLWKENHFPWHQITSASYLHARESVSSKGISLEPGLKVSTKERTYDFRSGPLSRRELEMLVYEVNLRLLPRFRVIIHQQSPEADAAEARIIDKASAYSYHPSGLYNKKVFRRFVIFNLVANSLLSYLVILALQISYPFIVAVIFLAFPFFFSAIFSVMVIKNGLVRNSALAIGLGLASGMCSMYFQYCFWNGRHQNFTFSQQLFHALQPNRIIEDTKRNFDEENQKWNWLVPWGFQLVYLSGILALGMPIQTKKPFSEAQQKWYDELEIPPLFHITDVAQFMNDLIAGSFIPLEHLEPAAKNKNHCVCILYHLENERCYLSVINKKLQDEQKFKSNPKFDSITMLNFFPINQEMGSSFKSIAKKQERPEPKKG
jgi:hypothetical protein